MCVATSCTWQLDVVVFTPGRANLPATLRSSWKYRDTHDATCERDPCLAQVSAVLTGALTGAAVAEHGDSYQGYWGDHGYCAQHFDANSASRAKDGRAEKSKLGRSLHGTARACLVCHYLLLRV